MKSKLRAADRLVLALAVAAGVALLVIGIRFLTVPHQAARFFGLATPPGQFDLHAVVALRDIWLALMLIGLAVLTEWRALALCLGLGALVCFADSAIVAGSGGRGSAVAFHIASGIYCAALAYASHSRTRNSP